MLTLERLKEVLNYNPNTGLFTRNIDRANQSKGIVVGCRDKDGYLEVTIDRTKYKLHRLAWFYTYGQWPIEIEHDNRVKDDNRLGNLKNVTRAENSKNHPLHKDNKLKISGLCWNRGAWQVYIGKRKYIGRYKDFFEACCARKSAEIKHDFHENPGTYNYLIN